MDSIQNRTFDELKPGDTASLVRTLTHKDIEVFADHVGDVNPPHVDSVPLPRATCSTRSWRTGCGCIALISAVLEPSFPAPGTIYVDQSLQFPGLPVGLGDTVTVTRQIAQKKIERKPSRDSRMPGGEPARRGRHNRDCGGDRTGPRKICRAGVVLPEIELRDKGRRLPAAHRNDQGA